jgi:hypothetical protein
MVALVGHCHLRHTSHPLSYIIDTQVAAAQLPCPMSPFRLSHQVSPICSVGAHKDLVELGPKDLEQGICVTNTTDLSNDCQRMGESATQHILNASPWTQVRTRGFSLQGPVGSSKASAVYVELKPPHGAEYVRLASGYLRSTHAQWAAQGKTINGVTGLVVGNAPRPHDRHHSALRGSDMQHMVRAKLTGTLC